MKKPGIKYVFFLLAAFLVCSVSQSALAQAKTDMVWTPKKAKKWFNSRSWANGLKVQAHPSIDKVEFARQYHKNKAVWDKAFAFMRDNNLEEMAPGKYPIDGDAAFASITEGPNKEFDQSKFESHRKYLDLQYVIKGKEKIGVADVSKATVTVPYNEKKDNANYTADGKYYIATPEAFFLFFPQQAHRPNIKVGGYDTVKKLVIKIEVVH